jgi:endonuclease III
MGEKEKEKFEERKKRTRKLVASLKKMYPVPETELLFTTPIQLVVAVMMSAQCTDKKVNVVTRSLYKKYKTVKDFANADPTVFEKEISSITYYRAKTRAIIGTAQMILRDFDGKVPQTERELVMLPGIAYKTAHVIMGELFGIYEGIPTDTHVRRFAIRFDLTDRDDLKKISKDLEQLILKKNWKYVNNGFVLYGRYVCPARPHDCGEHALTKIWPQAALRWPKTK